MVFNVRCFKCGEHEARLVLGGRAIIHARCLACDSNLLAEVMALEEEAMAQSLEENTSWARDEEPEENPTTRSIPPLADLPDLPDPEGVAIS